MTDFIHLHVHSTYSRFDGMATVEGLFARARDFGMRGLALTDHGNIDGLREFLDCSRRFPSVRPVAGCEIYTDGTLGAFGDSRRTFHLILLARNAAGVENLRRMMPGDGNGRARRIVPSSAVRELSEGLICTGACLGGEVSQSILHDDMEHAERTVEFYRDIFGEDFYLEVDLHPNSVERRIWPMQKYVAGQMFSLGDRMGVKVIAANDVHYIDRADAAAHDAMLCARTHSDPRDPDRFRYTGQEWFKSQDEMAALFPLHPEALRNTVEILDKVEDYRSLDL